MVSVKSRGRDRDGTGEKEDEDEEERKGERDASSIWGHVRVGVELSVIMLSGCRIYRR
jgi:hypothetical protein